MKKRLLGLLLLAALASAIPASAAEEEVWSKVKTSFFADRPILEQAGQILELIVPTRAEDAATVPILIRSLPAKDKTRQVQKIYLVIDKNPSPMGAVFSFTPESGRADVETRVRIEEYSMVRAIAELADGSLHMVSHFVKASGGCSAPAGKDQEAALARMGRMKLRLEAPLAYGQPNLAQLMISHPNTSGLAMDQLTRLYAPPRFVRHIDISYAGKRVLSADVDFTISENPNFRFYFIPQGDGELKADVVDSAEARFESTLAVRQGAE